MEKTAEMGSVEIGTGEGVFATLVATTVAALEGALREAMSNGEVFTLRFQQEKSGLVRSAIVNDASQVNFVYNASDVDEDVLAQSMPDFVETLRNDHELTVVVPQD
ncbi:hypothetical protein [Nesterenkonia lutea]|uniref:Uncharacterized protein n=1 Tax=Nesterenkonia lutea TaxID=272919 RepID=A0ABR9JCW0_9MICC|nr:hypothetical protein [Nesterenkonia lutea]MBE1523620.1 hypothetical protein [Nesterenkonia lutea]